MAKGAILIDEQSVQRFWDRVQIGSPDQCWPWRLGLSDHGYGRFKINSDYMSAHRMALVMVTESLPDPSLCALHSCDNRACCNPHHLRWGTAQDNSQDAVARGRHHKWRGERRGVSNPRSKLTEEQALQILARPNDSPGKMAREFGVAQSTVSSVRNGANWRHLHAQ